MRKLSPRSNPPVKYENHAPKYDFSFSQAIPEKTSGFDLTFSDLETANYVQKRFQGPYSPSHHQQNAERHMKSLNVHPHAAKSNIPKTRKPPITATTRANQQFATNVPTYVHEQLTSTRPIPRSAQSYAPNSAHS